MIQPEKHFRHELRNIKNLVSLLFILMKVALLRICHVAAAGRANDCRAMADTTGRLKDAPMSSGPYSIISCSMSGYFRETLTVMFSITG